MDFLLIIGDLTHQKECGHLLWLLNPHILQQLLLSDLLDPICECYALCLKMMVGLFSIELHMPLLCFCQGNMVVTLELKEKL